jgi:prepilin peptidase CpaA
MTFLKLNRYQIVRDYMWLNIMLLSIVILCVITDLHNRKIYNVVIFPGLIAAFISHLVLDGWYAVGYALLGFLVGLSILLIPYLLGGMGAGDVKLLALIGAIKGIAFVLNTAVYMALIGALIAVFVLLCRKGMVRRLITCFYFIYGLRYGVKLPLNIYRGGLSATYPYGVAIAGGAIMSYLVTDWSLL